MDQSTNKQSQSNPIAVMDLETERTTNLPWELIIEIFSRLPVKSLLRFRSVSKSCYSLITEPNFINQHLHHSTQHSSQNLKGVILSPTLEFHKHLVSCPLSSLSHKPIKDAVKLVYPMKDKTRYVKLSNSCDGLFCIEIIGDERVIFLWNPSTGEPRRLPNSTVEIPIGFSPEELLGIITHVLGFDSLNNDYKVLRVVKFDYITHKRIEAELYSLSTNSWTKINESPQYKWSDPSRELCRSSVSWTEPPFSCYKYVNGAIHWVGIEKNVVKSMNLSTERFGEIPLPNDAIMHPHKGLEINLAVLRGMLCVYCNHAKQSFVLWVMKNYGDQESWEKMFDIPYYIFDVPNTTSRLYHFFVPIYLYENGEFLLEECTNKGDAVVTYSKNRFGFKKIVVRGLNRIKEAHIYVESLISPRGQRNLSLVR